MALIENWFDYNQRQDEIQFELENAILKVPESNLTLQEFYLLYFLSKADNKELRQFELPDKLHLSASAVSRMIARLEAKDCGVVTKQACTDDKRATAIAITDYGEELLAKVCQEIDQVLTQYEKYLVMD